MKFRSFIAIALLSGVFASVSAGEIYRWNDANGNPVVSDRPPPAGIPYTTVGRKFGTKTNSAPTQTASDESEAPPVAEPIQADVAQERPVELVQDPALCERAKERIFTLETFARVRFTDTDGEVKYLSDEMRADELERANEIKKIHCK